MNWEITWTTLIYLDNIDVIESSVENLRLQLLPQVSKQLLIAGQEAYKKKRTKKQR